VKAGVAIGESDEWSWKAVDGQDRRLRPALPPSCGSSASTTKNSPFRHDGSDRRLTDVHGHVIEDILA
jgi:hypothetical protein